MKPKKNIFPILILIITIVSGLFIYPLVFADDTCKYHENHDELCGYVESVSEQPCTHEHDENCYNEILVCTKEEHIHNEECIQEVKTLICDHTTEEEHTDDCYSTEEEFICTKEEHTHTDDCLKEELACTHEHDETCGYVEAVVGHECTHICSNCDKELVREATLSFNADSNIQIETELIGQEGEDSVYFYLKMNKDLLDYIDLEEDNGVYSVGCEDNIRLELEPIYFSNDIDNVYLKYEQNYNSSIKFEIPISIPEDMIDEKIYLTTASSYNETEQKELSSLTIDEINVLVVPVTLETDETNETGENDVADESTIALGITKSVESVSAINENNLSEITWQVIITIPSEGIPSNTTITDTLTNENTTNQYMLKEQLSSIIDETNYTYTFYGIDGKNYTTYDELNDNTKIYKFEMENKNNIDYSQTPITLKYRSWADLSQIEGSGSFKNTASIQDKSSEAIQKITVPLSKLEAGQYGNYTLSYNEVKDAFIKDAQYSAYYNENSPLGTAGSFHLVGFNTVTLNTHTNGNVLANTLSAGSNFGTNSYEYELSYARNYNTINSTSASSTDDHILVVGSENELTVGGNNDIISINGTKIDKPYEIVQDTDSTNNPFIDLDRVEAEVAGVSGRLATVTTNTGVEASFTDQNNRYIKLLDSDGVGYYNITARDLTNYANNPLDLTGFSAGHNGSLIINVDCSNVKSVYMPVACIYVDGEKQSTNEVVVFSNGKVIWNFVNAEGVTIETNQMTGMVVALGATVNINQNLNGTVVAENIYVKAESHRTDFTGDIEAPEETKGASIIVRKVDRDNISTYLPNATFELYMYNGSEYVLDTSHTNLTTNNDGKLVIQNLVYNKAYKLVETTAPEGYILKDTPYEFIVSNSDTLTYPVSKPDNFTGESYNSGKVIYFKNEKSDSTVSTVSIEIDKKWYDINDNLITKASGEISVILKQNAYTDEAMTTSVASRDYGTYTISAPTWKKTIMNLPKTGTELINQEETNVYYSYSVKEIEMENYTTTYENNGGIVSGTIIVKNTSTLKDFVLPETGGCGILPYLISGFAMMVLGLIIYKKSTNRRVGEYR